MGPLKQNKKIQILVATLIFSITIFSLKKISFQNNTFLQPDKSLRFLLDSKDVIERCQMAEKKFIENYENNTYKNQTDVSELNESDLDGYLKTFIELIKNKSLDNVKGLKDNINRFLLPLILVGVDIVVLFFWIAYCTCTCCPDCCCNGKNGVTCCGKMSYTINLVLSGVIVLTCMACIILVTNTIYASINSFGCSLYKFTFHVLDGTEDNYRSLPEWKNLDDINSIIDKYDQIINKINSLEYINNCNGDDCKKLNGYIDKIKYSSTKFDVAKNCISEMKEKITPLFDTFEKLKDSLDKINDILIKYIDKYCKLGLNGLFAIFGVFSLLSLIIIVLYITCSCLINRLIYHLIWNIQMLLSMVIFLVAVGLNIVGILGKDFAKVIRYVKSADNLNSDNPLFLKIDSENVKYVDTCLNGDGDLTNLLGINDNYYPKFPLNDNEYTEVKNSNSNKEVVQLITEINENCESINNEINNPPKNILGNCQFAGSDIKIIIDQIIETLGYKMTLLSYFLLGECILTVLATFFGLIIVNQHTSSYSSVQETEDDIRRKERERKIRNELAKRKMDSSDIPIKA